MDVIAEGHLMFSGYASPVLLAEFARIPLPLHLVEIFMLGSADGFVGLALRFSLFSEFQRQIHLDLDDVFEGFLEVVFVDFNHLELFAIGQIIKIQIFDSSLDNFERSQQKKKLVEGACIFVALLELAKDGVQVG
jgi:hypothetical protein